MNVIQTLPATIRLLLAFVFILLLIRKKISLGTAFLSGAVFLGLLFAQPPMELLTAIATSVLLPSSLSLALLVFLILIFSNSMEKTGQMDRMLKNFKGLIKTPGINLVVFPALIGLLPMPGGAVFSAPMVKELGKDTGLSPARLSFINYWFRHIWECWWPLYPGVLLAVSLSGLDLFTFIIYMLPFTLLAVACGFFSIKGIHPKGHNRIRLSAKPFFQEMFPVLIVIAGGPGLGIILSLALPQTTHSREAGLMIALALSTLYLWFSNRISISAISKILGNSGNLKMVFMIFAILSFKEVLEHSHAVEQITRELTGLNIPVHLIALLLPFLVGLTTGITVAFVGISLPVVIPLVISSGNSDMIYAYAMLTFAGGFSGVLLSPLHLCLILSNQYFGTPMKHVYKQLIPLCVALATTGTLYFFISRELALP